MNDRIFLLLYGIDAPCATPTPRNHHFAPFGIEKDRCLLDLDKCCSDDDQGSILTHAAHSSALPEINIAKPYPWHDTRDPCRHNPSWPCHETLPSSQTLLLPQGHSACGKAACFPLHPRDVNCYRSPGDNRILYAAKPPRARLCRCFQALRAYPYHAQHILSRTGRLNRVRARSRQ